VEDEKGGGGNGARKGLTTGNVGSRKNERLSVGKYESKVTAPVRGERRGVKSQGKPPYRDRGVWENDSGYRSKMARGMTKKPANQIWAVMQ